MRIRSHGAVITALVTASLCSSCLRSLPFNHYILRAPQLVPGDYLGEVRVGGRCEVRIEDVTVRVSALDVGSLLIVLNFESDMMGYSFDPMGATVETADRGKLRPRAYVGPGELNWERGTYRTCVAGEQAAPLQRRTDSVKHALPTRDTCFVLEYPVQVVPPADVEFGLEGLSKGQAPVAPLRFSVGAQVLWGNVIDVQPAAAR
jgi:hypothetical protein